MYSSPIFCSSGFSRTVQRCSLHLGFPFFAIFKQNFGVCWSMIIVIIYMFIFFLSLLNCFTVTVKEFLFVKINNME